MGYDHREQDKPIIMKYKYLNKWLEEKNLRNFSNDFKLMLVDNESLTKRLEDLSKRKLSIKIMKQKNFYFSEENLPLLNKEFKGYAVHRSVLLNCGKIETIKAESFFPLKYLNGKEKFLTLLGEKSLGTYILKPKRFRKFLTKYYVSDDYVCRAIIYKYRGKLILVKEYLTAKMKIDSLTLLKCRRQV